MKKAHWDMPVILALAVWFCTLPIVALVVVFFGWGIGLTTAAGLLVAVLLACWLLCVGAFWRGMKLNKDEGIR